LIDPERTSPAAKGHASHGRLWMMSTPDITASTLQLLEWVAERPRGYAETMEAWRTSCPRLSVWEDALGDGLVRVVRRRVLLGDAGQALLTQERRPASD
jgi:hypothetical protein